jgi:hypothetical protein
MRQASRPTAHFSAPEGPSFWWSISQPVTQDKIALGIVLAGSLVLRVVLALRGGSFFWTDEGMRYGISRRAADALIHGQIRAALDVLFSSADHILFKIIGIIPAILEHLSSSFTFAPSLFFGVFSVVLIYQVWLLVLRLGGTTREALCCAWLLAGCNEYVYYARHVFPYDLALCFFLWSAFYGLRVSKLNFFLSGLLAGAGFLCYNGYWAVGATVLILPAIFAHGSWRSLAVRLGLNGVGLLVPVALIVGVGSILNHDLIKSYVDFSITNRLGDFGTAWSFIFKFFWAAEHFNAWFWALATIASLVLWSKGRLDQRVKYWLVGALIFYLGIVASSDLLKRFTIFARHGRPLAIFACLIGGWFIYQLSQSGRVARAIAGSLLVFSTAQSVFNLITPFQQIFPQDFENSAKMRIETELANHGGIYEVQTEKFETDGSSVTAPPFRTIERQPHPLQFRPYLLDGYSIARRAELRTRDMSMSLVQLLPEAPIGVQLSRDHGVWSPAYWSPYPGALRLAVRFDEKSMSPQPIVSAGTQRAGDLLFVECVRAQTIRLGLDHWGQRAYYSKEIACDFSQPHVIEVSFGSLYPEENDQRFMTHQLFKVLKSRLLVKFDSSSVIDEKLLCYPSAPANIVLFHNLVGFGTAERDFAGRVLSNSAVAPSEVLAGLGPPEK